MKCYYQIDDGEWAKGEMVSMSGGRQVYFRSRNAEGVVESSLTLSNPEILFHGQGFVVTGYKAIDPKVTDVTYNLMSVDVKWTKPRKK